MKKKKSWRGLNDKTSQTETDIKKTSLKNKSSKIANRLVRYVLFHEMCLDNSQIFLGSLSNNQTGKDKRVIFSLFK